MTQPNALRRFAAWLLRFCHRISPPSARDWGEAMLVELDFVEGDWPALAWAAGGAGVLMRRSLLHFMLGGGESASTAGGPAHRDPVLGGASMRKLSFGTALVAVIVLGVLLFAPSFRQALTVTTNSWARLAGREPVSESSLRRLAAQARAERDANTLAFVALVLPPGPESSGIAREAVQLDSRLTWVYCSSARRYVDHEDPQAGALIAEVEAWDPSNGYPKLLLAQGRMTPYGLRLPFGDEEKFTSDPRWKEAMAGVFAAPKFNSYLAEQMELDREIMSQRHLNDPMLAVRAVSSHPILNVWLLQRYALSVLDAKMSAGNTAVEGATPSAAAWKVARFGQVMSLQGQTFFERFEGAWLQREAYKRLEKIAVQAGDRDQQAMFAYQIESLDVQRHPFPDNGFLFGIYQWNAAAGQVALGSMLISGLLLLAGIAKLILVRREEPSVGRLSNALRVSAFVGGAGLLASAMALYVSYHPYAVIFNRFATGAAQADSLMPFWAFSNFAWTVGDLFPIGLGWFALLVLASLLLIFEVYRYVSSRVPTQETV